jgi:hypothetical protein
MAAGYYLPPMFPSVLGDNARPFFGMSWTTFMWLLNMFNGRMGCVLWHLVCTRGIDYTTHALVSLSILLSLSLFLSLSLSLPLSPVTV